MLRAAQKDAAFLCGSCEALRSSKSDGLQLLLEECSEELLKRDPTDVEPPSWMSQ